MKKLLLLITAAGALLAGCSSGNGNEEPAGAFDIEHSYTRMSVDNLLDNLFEIEVKDAGGTNYLKLKLTLTGGSYVGSFELGEGKITPQTALVGHGESETALTSGTLVVSAKAADSHSLSLEGVTADGKTFKGTFSGTVTYREACADCRELTCVCVDPCIECGGNCQCTECTCDSDACPDCGHDPCECPEDPCTQCGGDCQCDTCTCSDTCTQCGLDPCECNNDLSCPTCLQDPCGCCPTCLQYPCECDLSCPTCLQDPCMCE